MYDNILVPVSFEAERAAGQAVKVAERLAGDSARITLIHVIEAIPSYASQYLPADHVDKGKERALADLELAAGKVKGAEVAVIVGHAGQSILDYADKHDIDCIVIASHRPGVADYFLGSTAARVVRHAQCAVHVVR